MARRPRLILALAVLSALLASACAAAGSGSGSNRARAMLTSTFNGTHTVKSGRLAFVLTLDPSGSQTLTGPISLSFGGPFESLGPGKLPKSNFDVAVSAAGKSAALGLLSTGTSGYVSLAGTSYRLAPATYRRLESSFAGLAGSASGDSSPGTLSKLGIHPLDWLSHPVIVGEGTVGGVPTTHIRATVNVDALLSDLGTILQKASSVTSTKLPSGLSAASRRQIAAQVRSATFDLWTGTRDSTARKLAIDLTVPVSGQLQSGLGGLRSLRIGLTMQYADVNQPQTIAAPEAVRPISEFTAKLRSVLASVPSVGGALGASSAPSGTALAPASTTSPTERYTQCLASARGDVAKMQRCAPLINSAQ